MKILSLIITLLLTVPSIALAYTHDTEIDETNVYTQETLAYRNYKEKNYQKAFYWFSKASEQDSTYAESYLGYMHMYGLGIPQNDATALKWLTRAASKGDLWSMNNLAKIYTRNQGVPQDYGKALEWLTKAAERDDRRSQYDLGYMYKDGQGLEPNGNEALRWFAKAEAKGSSAAAYQMGLLYFTGMDDLKPDMDLAYIWLNKSAEAGYNQAAFFLKNNFQDGVPQTNVNFVDLQNRSWEKGHKALAQHWYTLAAEAGYADAQFELGQSYLLSNGEGHYDKALAWYLKAAEQGPI